MHQTGTDRAPSGACPRSNLALVVIAGLLLLLLTREGPVESSAMAQSGSPSGGLANPADQRNQMIAELRRLHDEVQSLRRSLEKPVRVEVVRMPDTTASR
ncbi:MAG: hypothetical protein IBJ10_05200 [Phycisphaerales bacterium]|nr:hypothetical protein [Phycisphaerales bacterium]